MTVRKLLVASLTALGVLALAATDAQPLQVKVSINFGPTITGPDNGTLVVAANSGDYLRITWALGSDSSIRVYRGLVFGVDTAEISRLGGFALELPVRASIRLAIRMPPSLEASSTTTHGRTAHRSASLGTAVSSGVSTTSSRTQSRMQPRTSHSGSKNQVCSAASFLPVPVRERRARRPCASTQSPSRARCS